MIIIDMNQISLASLMMYLNMNKTKEVDESMVRHMILNSIRMYRTNFKQEFGEVVLAWDSKHYWRRDYFPQYKAGRKKGRESSDLDWNSIFDCLNKIKSEIKENLPYKCLEVYGAEADDIIATLMKNPKRWFSTENIIISSDKDFIQLQRYPLVKQWSPVTKQYVNGYDPEIYLKEHILRGDSGDGVPNVLSPDNTFVDGLRQRPLSKKKIESWRDADTKDIPNWNDEIKRNYQRNTSLIDLSKVPEDIEEQIIKEYTKPVKGNRKKLLNYFTEKKLRELTENIGEF